MSNVEPDPRIGDKSGPGRRPGTRQSKRQRERRRLTAEEKRAAIQRRIAKEVAHFDFTRRGVELRRLNMTWVEIAQQMSIERAEPISSDRVKRAVLKELRNTEALADVRYAELDKLESMAANLRIKLDELDEQPPMMIDLEVYAKLADSYLKYRERISKLVGLDAPTKQQIDRGSGGAPGQPFGDGVSVHVHMPGSLAAFEEWQQLENKGLTSLAGEVLELEAGDHSEDDHHLFQPGEKAGVTLRGDVDVTPGAERVQPTPVSALEALAILDQDDP